MDETSLNQRIMRYAQVSKTGIGLLARLIGQQYLGVTIDRTKHAAQLRQALGEIKGPLMKIAQMVSTIPEALPPEYIEEFRQLQSNAPSMGWPFVKRRMAHELGPDWAQKFQHFEKEASFAASLGQVHQAMMHEGQKLALKLQYPQMDDAVEADLKQFKMILSLYHLYDKTIVTDEAFLEISDRLREELDYIQEAKHMAYYRFMLKDESDIHLPEHYPEFSTKRLLAMSWLEGRKIMSFVDAPQEIRNKIAHRLFKAWYIPFYQYGIIHGDPHLGNYTIQEDLSLNLLDFGCIRIFPASFAKGVIDLYHALLTQNNDLAVHAYESWGFKNLSNDLIEVLNQWAGFLYGPLLEDRERPIQETKEKGIYGSEIASKVHKELKRLGGITPPREFVFMDRAALGLGSVFMHLKADINWYQLFNALTQDFDEAQVNARQKELLAKF
jgi:predicted unusual protein kinase regulating ubiquinone biosynthesis (AarF/ABC1/UbiB family)